MEESGRDSKFYNDNDKKRVAGSNRDIISYNRVNKREDDYEDYNYRKELIKKESKNKRSNDKSSSPRKNSQEFVYYVVKSGDTLFKIAKRSSFSLKKILEINNLDEDSKIYRGMKLKIPTDRENKKSIICSSEKVSSSSKPDFLWPLKRIKGYSRDGKDGVKSIGIIIKGNPGGEVMASENGVVKRVGYMRGYGKYIVVNHGKRYITVYSNLMVIDVKAGDSVRKGGRIGNISDDMTLHFQIDREGKPENPLSLLPERS